jgi:hypothetical protein
VDTPVEYLLAVGLPMEHVTAAQIDDTPYKVIVHTARYDSDAVLEAESLDNTINTTTATYAWFPTRRPDVTVGRGQGQKVAFVEPDETVVIDAGTNTRWIITASNTQLWYGDTLVWVLTETELRTTFSFRTGTVTGAAASSVEVDIEQANAGQQRVILDLYDVYDDSSRWASVLSFLRGADIPCMAGLIGTRIDLFLPAWVATLQRYPRVEYFNHGDIHGDLEFTGPNYATQLASMQACHNKALSVLGVTLRGFGAPGAQTCDANTIAVMTAMGYEFWVFNAQVTPPGCRGIERLGGEMESPSGQINYANFIATYDPAVPLACFTGHPQEWTTPEERADFQSIISYLVSQGVLFTTPARFFDKKIWFGVGGVRVLEIDPATATITVGSIDESVAVDAVNEPGATWVRYGELVFPVYSPIPGSNIAAFAVTSAGVVETDIACIVCNTDEECF